jgi:hypothetical protein
MCVSEALWDDMFFFSFFRERMREGQRTAAGRREAARKLQGPMRAKHK